MDKNKFGLSPLMKIKVNSTLNELLNDDKLIDYLVDRDLTDALVNLVRDFSINYIEKYHKHTLDKEHISIFIEAEIANIIEGIVKERW